MYSNMFLAHLGGLPMYSLPQYLIKGKRALSEKSQYYKYARKTGLLESTYIDTELRGLLNEMDGVLAKATFVEMPGIIGQFGNAVAKIKSLKGKPAELYQFEEQWFKMAKFIHNIEAKKMSIKDSAIDAEKWLFNYGKVTKAQDAFRTKWYGAPFATFTFKAMPRMAEAAIKTPWRFALPAAMVYAMEEASQHFSVQDTDEQAKAKKKHTPEYMQPHGIGKLVNKVVPNFPRVPYVDKHGREHYLSLEYILPWGDIAESGGFMGIPGGIMPLSMPLVSEAAQQIFNYDKFYQEKMVPDDELAGKSTMGKAKAHIKHRTGHILKTALPTPVVGAFKVYQNLRGKPDFRGREKGLTLILLDELAGLKVYPVSYIDVFTRKMGEIHPKKGTMAKKIRSSIRTTAVKMDSVKDSRRIWMYLDKNPKALTSKIVKNLNVSTNSVRRVKQYNSDIEGKLKQLEGLSRETDKYATSFEKTLNKE